MGIFDFIKKKASAPDMKDLIWISHKAKLEGCLKLVRENPDSVLIAWFPNTQNEFQQFLQEKNGLEIDIRLARTVSMSKIADKKVFFLEHYPLRNKEDDLIVDWNVKQIYVLNSLDEPLFKNFGSDNIIQLMKTMGMKDDELIENSLISKSIVNAQKKIGQNLITESSANSSEDWFRRNIIS